VKLQKDADAQGAVQREARRRTISARCPAGNPRVAETAPPEPAFRTPDPMARFFESRIEFPSNPGTIAKNLFSSLEERGR
jgi:hypothetical protein